MTEQTLPLITCYKGWETYQKSLVEMIAPLSSEQLALPAASHKWTIGMLAQHMIGDRVWWYQVWMGEGNPETPADLEHVFQPPAALREDERERFPPFSRQWIVWHVLEHEIHHGGELSLALGEHGLSGIYGNL